MYGQEYGLDLALSFAFDKPEDADAFLDAYILTLKDENSFDVTNPGSVSMNKPNTYIKEIGEKLLVFGFDYESGWKSVIVEFRVMDVPVPEDD